MISRLFWNVADSSFDVTTGLSEIVILSIARRFVQFYWPCWLVPYLYSAIYNIFCNNKVLIIIII